MSNVIQAADRFAPLTAEDLDELLQLLPTPERLALLERIVASLHERDDLLIQLERQQRQG